MTVHISELPQVMGNIRSDGKTTAVIIEIESMKKFLSRIKFTGNIDELKYIDDYEDVARAVREGRMSNVTSHYVKNGFLEQRKVTIIDK